MKWHWTELRIEKMRRLAQDGYSAAVVARRLGTTRSAVLGKANRLDISFHAGRPVIFNKPKHEQIYAIGHEDEEICRGTNREKQVKRAYRILNDELPEGERKFRKKEVEAMVRIIL